jgi:hypothetical protein
MGIGTNLKEMALSFTRDDNLTGKASEETKSRANSINIHKRGKAGTKTTDFNFEPVMSEDSRKPYGAFMESKEGKIKSVVLNRKDMLALN